MTTIFNAPSDRTDVPPQPHRATDRHRVPHACRWVSMQVLAWALVEALWKALRWNRAEDGEGRTLRRRLREQRQAERRAPGS
jgi:hypothetical protein